MAGLLPFLLLQPIVFIPMPLAWQILYAIVAIALAVCIDAMVVHLVQAGQWRGPVPGCKM